MKECCEALKGQLSLRLEGQADSKCIQRKLELSYVMKVKRGRGRGEHGEAGRHLGRILWKFLIFVFSVFTL